ncbi:MAG: Holliday junction branch migration protein RuvA [Flavobacteriales bacterium]|nr:Holliday junction branch migration protein RuvA [Flavobacteriales bacterium]
MIDYLEGKLDRVTPTYAVVDCNGVGYLANISLNTYSQIKDKARVKLLTHLSIREDAHVLYGFADEHEREVFRLLISVSGVGAATARMILSSLTAHDTEKAIISGDLLTLKKIKGIGAKSAERIIVDLRDKVGKGSATEWSAIVGGSSGRIQEATLALTALGFNRQAIDKALQKVQADQGRDLSVEELIKTALKYL